MKTIGHLQKSFLLLITIFGFVFFQPLIFNDALPAAEILRPAVFTDLAGETSNAGLAIDESQTTAAEIITNVDAFPSIIYTWQDTGNG